MKLKMIVIELSRGERRVAGVLVSLGLFAVATVAFASVPTTFEAGQTLRASELNENFAALDERIATLEAADTPAGAVVAFDRETCPSGWSPYEPAAGRVVVGVNAADAKNELSERQRGEAFGEETHTLSVAQMPAHHHDVSIFNPVGPFENGEDDLVASGGSQVQAAFGSSPTGTQGEGEAFTNAQPSLVLLYCVKE